MRLFSFFVPLAILSAELVSCAGYDVAPVPDEPCESYELHVAPTFFTPEHYTFERRGNRYLVKEHFYRGNGGYSPKKLPQIRTYEITSEDWLALKGLVEQGGFWSDDVRSIRKWGYLDSTIYRFQGEKNNQRKKVVQYGEYSAFLDELMTNLQRITKK